MWRYARLVLGVMTGTLLLFLFMLVGFLLWGSNGAILGFIVGVSVSAPAAFAVVGDPWQ